MKDEQLLDRALQMDHNEARTMVLECLERPFAVSDEKEELALAHIYNCLDRECGEFWQRMQEEYTDPASREKLFRHTRLAKLMEKRRDHLFPSLNPFWDQRN